MNAGDLLVAQHRDILELLDHLVETKHDRELVKRALLAQIRAHATVEEELLYPLLAAKAELAELVAEAREDHQMLDVLLRDVETIGVDSGRFNVACKKVRTLLDKHIASEERDLLEPLDRHFSDALLDALGERMRLRHEQLIQRAGIELRPAP